MATRPPEHESIRTGRTPWPARLAGLLRARNVLCLLVVLMASYASLALYFRLDTPDGHRLSAPAAAWFDARIGRHLPVVPPRWGGSMSPGVPIRYGEIEWHHWAPDGRLLSAHTTDYGTGYGWSDALAEPRSTRRHSFLFPTAGHLALEILAGLLFDNRLGVRAPFVLVAAFHLAVVALYRAGHGWVHPWRSPLRYRRHAFPGSFAWHAAVSAVLSVPLLALSQWLRAFWATTGSGALRFHNIYGDAREAQAVVGLLGAAFCLHLLAVVVAGRLTARTQSSRAMRSGTLCHWCGYPVGQATCPECGRPTAVPSARKWRAGRVLGPLGLTGAALLLAFTPLLMSWWTLVF